MTYEELPPSTMLREVVSCYWRFALPHSSAPATIQHTIPPDGVVNVCWLPPGRAVVLGPRVTALRVPVVSGFEYMGTRFRPGAGGAMLRMDTRRLRDNVIHLPDDHDVSVAIRKSGLPGLDACLQSRVLQDGWDPPDPLVLEIAARITRSDGTLPVSALIADLGLSYRQILRRFHQASGLTIKEFARLRRLRAVCLEAVRCDAPRWADISAGTGFADQAHLVREFNDIYGWPPRLVHEYLRRIEHLTVLD